MANQIPDDAPDLYLERRDDVWADLDPKLQELALAYRAGEVDGAVEKDVIAKLKDPAVTVPGLAVVSTIGDIVTGRVAVADIESARRHPNMKSLKLATGAYTNLRTSLNEVRCDAQTLRQAFPGIAQENDGLGVVVGIVDTGCDFRHGNFRDSSLSRLLFLWDQRESNRTERRPVRPTAPPPAGYGYGREFGRERLNAALGTQDAYTDLDYELLPAAHGTHVMDIAAGNGQQTNQPGIAPKADLIFVHVDVEDVANSESLGNSRHLLEAVEYVFKKAGDRPAVVNISLGTSGGPHDGTTPVEQALDRLAEKPGRAIVIAAGNSFDRRSHIHGSVQPGRPTTLTWEIRPGDETPNEMEIWYDGRTRLEVELIAPGGRSLGPAIPLGESRDIKRRDLGKKRLGRIIHRRNDPNNNDHQIDLLLTPSLPKGTWQVNLSTPDHQPVEFHAWIERDFDDGQSHFTAEQATPSFTLGSISCGRRTIAVGSYDPRTRELSTTSSAGPTRDNKEDKPEVSAPGEGIVAASAKGSTTVKSGTSMAAPHVTGLIALIFQVGGMLQINRVRQILKTSARREPPAGALHDSRYGYGRIDGVVALQAAQNLRQPAPVPIPALSAADITPMMEALAEPQPMNGQTSLPAGRLKTPSGTYEIDVRVKRVEI